MNNITSKLLTGLLLVLSAIFELQTPAVAQTTTTTTTLAASVAQSDQSISVASATGITAPSNGAAANATTILFADKEEMRVIGVSGTTITVQRGSDGTPVQAHTSGALLWVGPPAAFSQASTTVISGACTAANIPYLPLIAVGSGRAYTCGSAGKWVSTGYADSETGWIHRQKATVAATYVASLADYYIGVTDTASARAITLPAAKGMEGRVYIVMDESGGASSHNITMTPADGSNINGSATDVISSNYGVSRYISDGTNWFKW